MAEDYQMEYNNLVKQRQQYTGKSHKIWTESWNYPAKRIFDFEIVEVGSGNQALNSKENSKQNPIPIALGLESRSEKSFLFIPISEQEIIKTVLEMSQTSSNCIGK